MHPLKCAGQGKLALLYYIPFTPHLATSLANCSHVYPLWVHLPPSPLSDPPQGLSAAIRNPNTLQNQSNHLPCSTAPPFFSLPKILTALFLCSSSTDISLSLEEHFPTASNLQLISKVSSCKDQQDYFQLIQTDLFLFCCQTRLIVCRTLKLVFHPHYLESHPEYPLLFQVRQEQDNQGRANHVAAQGCPSLTARKIS